VPYVTWLLVGSGGSSGGARGAPAPPTPTRTKEFLKNPTTIFRHNNEGKGEKWRKKKDEPPLRFILDLPLLTATPLVDGLSQLSIRLSFPAGIAERPDA